MRILILHHNDKITKDTRVMERGEGDDEAGESVCEWNKSE